MDTGVAGVLSFLELCEQAAHFAAREQQLRALRAVADDEGQIQAIDCDLDEVTTEKRIAVYRAIESVSPDVPPEMLMPHEVRTDTVEADTAAPSSNGALWAGVAGVAGAAVLLASLGVAHRSKRSHDQDGREDGLDTRPEGPGT